MEQRRTQDQGLHTRRNHRPPLLDDLGLAAALEWLTDDFTQRFNVAARLRIDTDDAGFTPLASSALFRIVQEALTNVARHAQARQVKRSSGFLAMRRPARSISTTTAAEPCSKTPADAARSACSACANACVSCAAP
nr:hypothetical protein [Paraburkholderia xenovorans]